MSGPGAAVTPPAVPPVALLPPGAVLLERAWLARDALEVAPDLLGKIVAGTAGRWGRIVEVEAYRADDDPGSHAYRGPTARNAPMWGGAGHLYVYLIYGMHHCANVVTGPDGVAQAVLIRAVAPGGGLEVMREARWGSATSDPGRGGVGGPARRGRRDDRDLCRGPARFAQAFGLTRIDDGIDLLDGPSSLLLGSDGCPPPGPIAAVPRVGLTGGSDLPWRFAVADHAGVSAPRPPVGARWTGGGPGVDRRRDAG